MSLCLSWGAGGWEVPEGLQLGCAGKGAVPGDMEEATGMARSMGAPTAALLGQRDSRSSGGQSGSRGIKCAPFRNDRVPACSALLKVTLAGKGC